MPSASWRPSGTFASEAARSAWSRALDAGKYSCSTSCAAVATAAVAACVPLRWALRAASWTASDMNDRYIAPTGGAGVGTVSAKIVRIAVCCQSTAMAEASGPSPLAARAGAAEPTAAGTRRVAERETGEPRRSRQLRYHPSTASGVSGRYRGSSRHPRAVSAPPEAAVPVGTTRTPNVSGTATRTAAAHFLLRACDFMACSFRRTRWPGPRLWAGVPQDSVKEMDSTISTSSSCWAGVTSGPWLAWTSTGLPSTSSTQIRLVQPGYSKTMAPSCR